MKQSSLIIAAAVVVVVAGAVVYFQNERNKPATQSTSETVDMSDAKPLSGKLLEAKVSYTDAGFQPGTLAVSPGTVVTFTNDSAGNMHPASDPHPTHTSTPGFDAKSPKARGESYSFTFNDPGTYTYHDHLKPSFKGKIIVK